jgi:hypothetical protein
MNYTIYVEINMYIKEEKEKKGGENWNLFFLSNL